MSKVSMMRVWLALFWLQSKCFFLTCAIISIRYFFVEVLVGPIVLTIFAPELRHATMKAARLVLCAVVREGTKRAERERLKRLLILNK